jgi:glycosyltransferase involved in cell wall biosynthesis
MMDNTWVVLPAKDEAHRIVPVLTGIKQYIPVNRIVVVDDGSKDYTWKIAGMEVNHIINNVTNYGKARALLIGIDYAIEKGADNIIIMDSDGQHDPKKIPVLLSALVDHDIVFGSRHREDKMPLLRRFGNAVISNMINTLFGVKVLDALSGYKAFTKEAYDKIRWDRSQGYLVESDILINTAINHLKYSEIIVPTMYKDTAGITKTDGLKIIINILKRKINQ